MLARLQAKELEQYVRIKVSDDGNLFEIIVPGCPTLDEDRNGDTAIGAVVEYLNFGRMTALHHPQFSLAGVKSKGYQMFLTYMEHEISLKFYKEKKKHSLFLPMKFSTRLQSMGKSSLNLVTVMRHAVTGVPLAYAYATLVRVDLAKRKSDPIPDQIRDKFKHLPNEQPRHEFSSVTADSFVYSTVTRFSDSDTNQHINYASYFNYCMDAAAVAASRGKLKGFSSDRQRWLVKKLKCSFAKESKAEETLTVTLWQDSELFSLLHFRITRSDGQLSFVGIIEYHMNEDDINTDIQLTDRNTEILHPSFTDSLFTLSADEVSKCSKVTYSKDGSCLELTLPMPIKFNLNFKRKVSVEAIGDYLYAGSVPFMYGPNFLLCEILPASCVPFLLQVDYIFHAELHDFNAYGLYVPMKCSVEVVSTTRSTINSVIILSDMQGKPLVTVYNKQVCVDLATRKSAPIKAGIQQRLQKHGDSDKGFTPFPDLLPPSNCFTSCHIVRYSDSDTNMHLKQIGCIKLCMDTSVSAAQDKRLGRFLGNAYDRRISVIKVSFSKEFRIGETFVVSVWNDALNIDRLNFIMSKTDGKPAMRCIMDFFSDSFTGSKL